MADGTIKIDIDIPVNKVKSDSHAVNEELERIGKNAGKDMDSSFKKNADSVKREAKSTGEDIDKSIGKEHKTKIEVDSSKAKTQVDETRRDLDKIPKKHETKFEADDSDAKRKADETKRKTDEVPKKHNTDFNATDHTGGVFARIKSHFDGINQRGEKTHSLFKTIFSANIISNAAMGALNGIKGAIGGIIVESKQYALEQQTMNATWLTLTNSASKGRAMVKQINDMAIAAQNSTHMVDQLSQKFYAINNNAEQTGKLTKAVLTLQDAFGQSDAAVENFGTQFSQMMANGKVSAQDMMSIVNTFPKLKPLLRDYEREIHHNSKLTTKDLSDMMSKGEISSQDMINTVLRAGQKYKKATGNFTATIPGMVRSIKASISPLTGALATPIEKMKTPFYGAVVKWLSAEKTKKEFSMMGKTVSHGMSQVLKAFSGGNTINITKSFDKAIQGINKGLKGVFGWVSAHAKDLKTIAASLGSIAGQIAKSVWRDFASIIRTIGNMFGITAKNGKASGSAIHVIAKFLNGLAKNKLAIQAISKAIVAIAVVKGLDRVGGGLFAIGEKGYGAYRKIKFLIKGMQGIKDIEGLSKAEQGFLKFGNGARKAGQISKKVFSAIGKLGKGAWNGIKFATKSFVKSFTAQLKIIGKGIKGLGSIAWNAAKSVGSKFLSAGKFLGSKIAQGLKASMKFGMGKRLAVGALAGAAVAAPEAINAVKDRHSADKRSKDIGGAVGAIAGGTLTSMIPVVGPMLAPIGAIIGKYAGRWGGQAVNKFTKGWQRNKPPKKFWSLENLGYSAHNMWKGFTKGVTNTIKWFKKNWKEVGLYFVSPLAGAINSLYKHNKKFNKWVNGLVKGFKNAWKGIVKWFSKLGKNIQKSWKGMVKWFKNLGKNMAKGLKSAWHSMTKWFADIAKGIKKAWHSMTSWFSKLGHGMSKGLKATWHGVVKFFSNIVRGVKGAWHGVTGWFSKLGSNAVKGFKSAWNGIRNWFKGIIDGIKSAWDGFWDKVSGPFKFLGKVFSGKAKIGSIHFANGTDWQTRWGVPAILNDGNDSPQTNNRESLIYPDGTWELLPNKRNLKRILPFGTDVVNARDTANLASRFMHYADGTLDLEDLNVSKSQENVLKKLLRINSKQLQVVVEEARRKRDRDRKQAQHQKSKDHKSKKRKPLKITIDNKKRKGSVLVDKGLLTGSLKETGHETWINEKLFKRLMSYTKAKPIKVSKNSRIRYRAIPTRRNSKGQYLVDSKWLTGAKRNTGKLEALTRDAYLKLLQFTKAERKYKLPKKRRKTTTHRRSTTRRRSTRRASTRSYSIGSSISSVATHVSASVSGIKSVNALAKAVKAIKGKHKITIKAKASGSKSINKLARSVKKVAGKHKVTIKTKGLKSLKSLYKAAKRIKGSTHRVKVKTSGTAGLKKLRSAISSVASESKKATKSIKGKGNFAKAFASLTKSTDKSLSKLRSNAEKEFKSMWSNLKKNTSGGIDKIDHDLSRFDSKFKKQWRSLSDGVERIFSKFWKSMKSKARGGLNDVISVLNSAIGKIDNVIGQFGGSKNAVHKVARLATGTGALGGIRRPITAPTLAILNDGNDSPKTGNREAIWDRNTGNVEVVPGRFTPRILKPGQEVFNATETAMLGYTTPQHFATGTGALKELYHIAKRNWEHPQKTGQALFSAVTGLTGAINQLAQGARKKGENQGVKWWSQLWKMVDDRVNGEGGDLTGLAKHMAKYGHGKPYIWGGESLKGFDCSGLVQYTLAHDYGINLKGRTVGDFWGQVEHIPKSEAKAGDLVFWLPNHHIGAYLGGNHYYSAQSPDNHPNIGVNTLDSVVGEGTPHFGRIKGLSDNDKDKGVKANSALQKLIKRQVWDAGFTKTIDKIRDKYGEANLPNISGSAKSWISYIKRAAEKMHTSVSSSDIAKIVSMIAGESSGNAKVIQKVWDVNMANGNPAKGLLQFIPQTFAAFAAPGHHQILNGFDQLLALFNDSNWRNDIHYGGGWGPTGHRRFARGGILHQPETIDVAEAGHPESIIPWDPAYRDRALAIMQATLDHFMAQDGKSQRYQSQAQQAVDLSKTNAEIEAINEKFDAALAQLGILTNKNEVIQLTNTLDKRVIGEAMYAVTKNKLQRDVRNEAYRISGHH